MPLVLLASGSVAALFGLVVGLPSLRLRGDYLAIVTLGFAEIFRLVIATAQTGGTAEGPISRFLASLGGQNGYAGPEGSGVPQYAGPFWIFGAVLLATVFAWRLKFSGWGRALRALREDEIAASAVGVDPTRYKVVSFVIAAAGAGVAGGLFASMYDGSPTVQPDSFTFTQSFDAITMVILGGSGSVTGAIFGGVFVTVTVKLIEQFQPFFREQLGALADSVQASAPGAASTLRTLDLNALRMVVYAGVLIGLMILRPEGLFGEREIFRRKRSARGAGPGKDKGKPPDGARRDDRGREARRGARRRGIRRQRVRERGRPVSALELRSVTKRFGGLRAVGDVTFTVPARSIFGLIGPNGAGKTTVFNLITGVYKPDEGSSIRFGDTDLLPLKPPMIARLGIARTFQNIRLFGQLTVIENVLVACEKNRKAHLGAALLRSPLFYRDEADEPRAPSSSSRSSTSTRWPTSPRPASPTATSGASRSPAR
jgi:ABC-type branched-subunit amino acid transport system permease subunit